MHFSSVIIRNVIVVQIHRRLRRFFSHGHCPERFRPRASLVPASQSSALHVPFRVCSCVSRAKYFFLWRSLVSFGGSLSVAAARPEGPPVHWLRQRFRLCNHVLGVNAEFFHDLRAGSAEAKAMQTDHSAVQTDVLPPGIGNSGLDG